MAKRPGAGTGAEGAGREGDKGITDEKLVMEPHADGMTVGIVPGGVCGMESSEAATLPPAHATRTGGVSPGSVQRVVCVPDSLPAAVAPPASGTAAPRDSAPASVRGPGSSEEAAAGSSAAPRNPAVERWRQWEAAARALQQHRMSLSRRVGEGGGSSGAVGAVQAARATLGIAGVAPDAVNPVPQMSHHNHRNHNGKVDGGLADAPQPTMPGIPLAVGVRQSKGEQGTSGGGVMPHIATAGALIDMEDGGEHRGMGSIGQQTQRGRCGQEQDQPAMTEPQCSYHAGKEHARPQGKNDSFREPVEGIQDNVHAAQLEASSPSIALEAKSHHEGCLRDNGPRAICERHKMDDKPPPCTIGIRKHAPRRRSFGLGSILSSLRHSNAL